MQTVCVNLKNKAYNIEIDVGLLSAIGNKVTKLLPKACKAAIISDSNVAPLYAKKLEKSLSDVGLEVSLIIFPAGEQSKNMETLSKVLEKLAENNLTRTDVILTLGGGVVGDLGGFAAASYMRGIPLIHVPTSLLAQIDSSVGGKVAVDLTAGKNLAGAFYQPKAVFIDPSLLRTLPIRFLYDGLAEAIKYGCIRDKQLFSLLESFKDIEDLLNNAEEIIAACCNIKARIVENDEFDTGMRMLLNFGHTLGHAVEQYFKYSSYTHGEGVAIGMYQLTKRTESLGFTSNTTTQRLQNILEKYHLPLTCQADKQTLLDVMAKDKKKNGKEITLVILKEIGTGVLHKIDWQKMPKYLG